MGGGRESPTSPSQVLGLLWVLRSRVPQVHRAGTHCRLLAQSLMAGSCEISNIFSNYISAMYQPDEVQPTLDMLGHLEDNSTLGLSVPTSQPLAQSTGRTWGAVVAAQGRQHIRQQRGGAAGLEERCKVLVPLGQVNSFHYASVSPRACWLKEDPKRHKVWLLGAHQVHKGDEGSLPSSPSTSQGTGCQGSSGEQFGSTVLETGVPLRCYDRHGMALGDARGTYQHSRVDPSTDGTNHTETNSGGSIRLLSPRTGAGQSEVTQEQALSACPTTLQAQGPLCPM